MYKKLSFILYFIISIGVNAYAFNNKNDIPSTCKPPSNLKIIEISTSNATISWKSTPTSIAWKIIWRKKGEDYLDSNSSGLINEKEYTFSGLTPSTKYYFKLQSLCNDDSESRWTYEYSFTTHFENPSLCNLDLEINDAINNNDKTIPGKTSFIINNLEYTDGKLGVDVFIQNIKLILNHTWANDLEIKLWSPSGKSIILSSSHKPKDENSGYGNIDSIDCSAPIIFSDESCKRINNETKQFIGYFKPDEPLNILYDSISPLGNWKLEITDKSVFNIGTLEYFEINFAPLLCPTPHNVSVIPQNDNAILVKWDQDPNIDSVFLKLNINGNNEYINCDNTGFKILSGLNNLDTMYLSAQSKCNNDISAFSCADSIIFLCSTPQIRENFDDFENCQSTCEDCINKGIWFNNSFEQNWLINSGETSTKNTGPLSDLYGNGKYVYFESSNNNCNEQGLSILESQCIYIEPAFDGCSMEFSYHMYGVDIGSLTFEASIDNGLTWQSLFNKEGEVSNKWITQEIDLNDYENKTCKFRFVARSKNHGSYGDIALDDIIFYNSRTVDIESNLFYPDRDNDGYGKDTLGTFFCNIPSNHFVSNNYDCNDSNATIHPGAIEIPCNFIDENCNGMNDDSPIEIPFEIVLDSIIKESCDGKSDGEIILKVTNGIPPYSFKWSNGSTDSLLTNVQADKYWCLITDQSGCGIITDTFALDYNRVFDFNIENKTLPTCNGKKDGRIDVNIFGGNTPYQYSWNNGDTTKNINQLGADKYILTVFDSLGCRFISPEIELKANATFDIALLDKVNPSCYGFDNGKIDIRVLEGAPPYNFEWNSNDFNSNSISDLPAGKYYCTITDSALCFQEYGPIELKDPDSLNVFISSIDHVSCQGENNGLIETGTYGGLEPYTFEWKYNDKTISRTDDIYNLETGNYSLYVNDKNGCLKTINNIEIKNIDSLTIALDSIKNVNCSDTKDGFISINASGGYGNYYYYWNNGQSVTNKIDSLNTGLYSVTVEDDLACKQVLNNIEIANINIPLNIDLKVLDSIKCFSDTNGIIIANVISNSPPYDYNWNSGVKLIKFSSSDTLRELSTGSYLVTVTDNDGCVGQSNTIYLSQPSKFEFNDITIENIFCNGDNTGEISVQVKGGVKPYSSLWNNGESGLENTRLISGDYYITVTDSNNCKINSEKIVLSEPEELSVTIESTPAHKGKQDGSAIILPTGGVTPYIFEWDENANSQTGNEANNLSPGWYTVTITDFNECVSEIKVFISELPTDSNIDLNSTNIYYYPNPVTEGLYISFQNEIDNSSFFEIIDFTGKKLEVNPEIISDEKIYIPLNNWKSGIYFIHLFNHKKHYYNRIVILD